jgi:hypothetical protein
MEKDAPTVNEFSVNRRTVLSSGVAAASLSRRTGTGRRTRFAPAARTCGYAAPAFFVRTTLETSSMLSRRLLIAG